jgi:hypothetical protein
MSLLHVAITGRDKRHLSALGPKLRIVVVSYQETRHGITVDAYVRSEKIDWLKKQGYGVTTLENVEPHDRERQAEEHAAAKRRLAKGRYGDIIWSVATSLPTRSKAPLPSASGITAIISSGSRCLI